MEDRLVQQALRMLLEPIFAADFLPSSHGFRQGHSPHTALCDVARMYPRVSWVIEGDIVGCFDNIPHRELLQAVARRIADGKMLSLLRTFTSPLWDYSSAWRRRASHTGANPYASWDMISMERVKGMGRKSTLSSLSQRRKDDQSLGNFRKWPVITTSRN